LVIYAILFFLWSQKIKFIAVSFFIIYYVSERRKCKTSWNDDKSYNFSLHFKNLFISSAMQSFVCPSNLDCSYIIWTLDDADPVVLGGCIPWGVRASLPLHSAELFKSNFSVYNWKKKCAIDHSSQKQFATSFFAQTLIESSSFSAFDCNIRNRSYKSGAVCCVLFLPNIDGELEDVLN